MNTILFFNSVKIEQSEEALFESIIKTKNESRDRYCEYTITPELDDEVWNDAIEDARGSGVPYKCFFDTSDKTYISLDHFPALKGRYIFNPWSDNPFEDKGEAYDKLVRESTIQLFRLGIRLKQKYNKVVFAMISGSCKGYLNCYFIDITKDSTCNSNMIDGHDVDKLPGNQVVLFVYANTPLSLN